MNNITLNSERKQEKKNKTFSSSFFSINRFNKKKHFSLISDSSLSEDVVERCRSLVFAIGYTPKRMKVIETILPYLTHYRCGYLKMHYIAEQAGVSLTTVETVMRLLEKEGVIVQQRRFWKHREISSSFHLGDLYRNKDVLVNLSYWFPCLKKFRDAAILSVCFLLSMNVAQAKQSCRDEYESFEARILFKEFIYKKSVEADQFIPPLPYGVDYHSNSGSEQLSLEQWSRLIDGKKEENVMFAKSVETIKSLELTAKGKAELSCFSDKAIYHADGELFNQLQYGKKYGADEAWRYFCKLAHTFSRHYDLPINYSLSVQLCREGGYILESVNVKHVASPPLLKKGRIEKLPHVSTVPSVQSCISKIQNKEVSPEDKQRIERKIKFYSASIKAAQGSTDIQSQKCIEVFTQYLSVWTQKLAFLTPDKG